MRGVTKEMLKMNTRDVRGTGSFARVLVAETHLRGEPEPRKLAVKVMNKAKALTSAFVNLQNEIDICATMMRP